MRRAGFQAKALRVLRATGLVLCCWGLRFKASGLPVWSWDSLQLRCVLLSCPQTQGPGDPNHKIPMPKPQIPIQIVLLLRRILPITATIAVARAVGVRSRLADEVAVLRGSLWFLG